VPYIERVINKLVYNSDDPVIKGWKDFGEHLGMSAAISLAFRVKESHHYHQMVKNRQHELQLEVLREMMKEVHQVEAN
jgi:hypothetical protein